MEINEINKQLYEAAFISNGEYGACSGDGWKPSINEREIEEWCGDEDGNYKPATPLGYRDYAISREEGLKSIFSQEASAKFTYEKAHELKRDNNSIKQYDRVEIDGTDYIVVGDDEEKYYIVSEEGKVYCITYLV